uniref:UV-stimulated scaffold protein A n=1 Tax=Angiostrongylus cantonensis TaxID=6313 RepID=A0A0K0CT03_ANGCA
MADDILRLLRLITVKLVNEAAGSNDSTISTDSRDFKRLKHEVRTNEGIIPDYLNSLIALLKRFNSKRRKALMSLFDYFFNRCHLFRENTVERLQVLLQFPELLLLVCETNPLRYPLPGPIAEAQNLKAYAIAAVKKWHEKFGPGYEKLNYVADFLRQSKAVDFDSASAELLAERMRRAEEEQHAAARAQQIAFNVRRKFDETKIDIERCIASAETALSILVPLFGADSETNSERNSLATHGYSGVDTISVVLPSLTPEISINTDNETLIEALQDSKVMLDAYRKNIVSHNNFSWQNKINGAPHVELLMRDLTVLKGRIDQQCQKINELKVKPKKRISKGTQSSDSEESDLELVPEKQVEDFIQPDEVPRHIIKRVKELEDKESVNQPCCSKSLEAKVPDVKKEEDQHMSRIPVVPFGLDLKYWGERRTQTPIPRNTADCHRFWRPPEDDDRCPLHGTIIDRDDEGFPLKEIGSAEPTAAQAEREQQEEEEYLMDLEAGTGQTFVKKSKRRNQRNLTVRQRLEKKLLDPRTVKRVSAALDAACKARIQRKFGQQFSHSLLK